MTAAPTGTRPNKSRLGGVTLSPADRQREPGPKAPAKQEASSWSQRIAELQIRSMTADPAESTASWEALVDASPEPEAIREYVRWLKKAKRIDDIVALVDRRLPSDSTEKGRLVQRAELLDEAALFDRSDPLFERLMLCPGSSNIRINFAKRLRKRGLIIRALEALLPIADSLGRSSRSRTLFNEIRDACDLLGRLEPERLTRDADARLLALHQAILMFRERPLRTRPAGELGRLVLVTGSMGPGGAERQIVRIAGNLERARREERSVGGILIDQPVEVIVKSLSLKPRADFFAPDLAAQNVTLREIDRMPVTLPDPDDGLAPDLCQLLKLLPPQANYGVGRLTGYLRDNRIDVAGLWQDGACFFGALAALIAGVPTIQLSFRGLPPSLRLHMFRPEYEYLYRALAQVPGIQFHCNSAVAAREYGNWLGIPIERFSVIYNGVAEHSQEGSPDAVERWRAFQERTVDATRTIGGVFRFDIDKRPLVWLRLAARYLKRFPDTRFVLVGDGRLLDQARALATTLAIADRVLFVGSSAEVGFWMSHMNVLLLTSRFEGLPNVLIEAQMAGTPVVSTPAGGAAECFVEGVTGHILDCADKPDLDAACDKIEALVLAGFRGDAARELARRHASEKFSVEQMLCHFTSVCGQSPAVIAREGGEVSQPAGVS